MITTPSGTLTQRYDHGIHLRRKTPREQHAELLGPAHRDPVAILAECARVLRSRGQLLIFDRDFASSAMSLEKEIAAKIDLGDIARAFAAQPCIIRQLPRLLADTGFAIETHRSYVIADVGRAEFFSDQLTTWRRLLPVSGVISKGEADLLMNGLQAASAAGTLFWANNFYTFVARKIR